MEGREKMNKIENQTFDEERALYHIKDTEVINCVFAGKQDGESVLKETRNIKVENCQFSLRYPLWHAQKYTLLNSSMDELTRAPIWYSHEGMIDHCCIEGIKILRECSHTIIQNSHVDSPEFGWQCNDITILDSEIQSEYMMLYSNHVKIDHLKFSGKYSFQYMNDLEITNSYLDTKDAFWHSQNIVVKDSVLKGEYLAWFSKGLTLINCKIIGTQPFCYCEDLKLIDCEMIDCDLSFEYSDVEAHILGHVDSIKNVKSGLIVVDSVGEVIHEDAIMETNGKIVIRNQMNKEHEIEECCCQ
jgi:Protein of unknown function (DUF3737).